MSALLISVARIQKKLLNFTDAINTYRLIEQKYSQERMNGGVPWCSSIIGNRQALFNLGRYPECIKIDKLSYFPDSEITLGIGGFTV